MNDVAERLRASKKQSIAVDRQHGREHGRNWAAKEAGYYELRRLGGGDYVPPCDDNTNLAAELDKAIGCEVDPRNPEESLWYNTDAEKLEYPSDEYVSAFIDGAREVWEEVKDRV
jgi:hypothetical protein